MAIRVGINGFGRIGRLVCRIATSRGMEVVGINDLVPADNLAYLLRYDTMHGRFDAKVEADETSITINGKRTACSALKDPPVRAARHKPRQRIVIRAPSARAYRSHSSLVHTPRLVSALVNRFHGDPAARQHRKARATSPPASCR